MRERVWLLPVLSCLVAAVSSSSAAAQADAELLFAATFRAEARGDDGCAYGTPGCTRCVNDVPGTFVRLGGVTARYNYRHRMNGALPWSGEELVYPAAGYLGAHDHVEGYGRIPGSPGENWMVLSRATEPGGNVMAGLLSINLYDVDGQWGEAIIDPNGPLPDDYYVRRLVPVDPLPEEREGTCYRPFVGSRHLGGVQMLGSVVVVPAQCEAEADSFPPYRSCSTHWVELLDYTEPCSPRSLGRIDLPKQTSDDTSQGRGAKAFYASAARLANGRTLLLVNRSDMGDFDVFISEMTILDAGSRWLFVGSMSFATVEQWAHSSDNDNYQGASLVTECGSGDLFLVAMRQLGKAGVKAWTSDNGVDLFRLIARDDDNVLALASAHGVSINELESHEHLQRFDNDVFALEFAESVSFGQGEGDSCEMRGGASVHVTPSGSMTINCSAGHDDGWTMPRIKPGYGFNASEIAPR
jgi:hypothetical protein